MDEIQPADVVPVVQFAEQHPNLGNVASLRWQIFHEHQNGLADAGAIVRRGRRVFIVVPRYLAWMLGESRRDYHKT